MAKKLPIALVKKELKKRKEGEREKLFSSFSVQSVCDKHVKQLSYVTDTARHQIAMTCRRGGKSFANCLKLASTAINNPKTNSLYVALTYGQAKDSVWREIWLPLCAKWGFPVKHNESELLTTFKNGSTIKFRGTDDIKTITTFLGNKFKLIILDEAQDQTDTLLKPLLETILPSCLQDLGGTMVLSGTIPQVAAGLFYEIFNTESSYSKHNWGRLDNPFLSNQLEELNLYLASRPGMTIEDPVIQRDFYGKFAYDPHALVFQYLPFRNGYSPLHPSGENAPNDSQLLPNDLKYFALGIDPGTKDRCAISVIGWNDTSETIWHVHEWVLPKGNESSLSDIKKELDNIDKKFAIMMRYIDMGGSNMGIDTFTNDSGKYVVHAAKKVDLVPQIERMNNLLQLGRLKIIKGSELEKDLQTTRWDIKAKAKGQNRYSSHNHPDVADSIRYALAAYWDYPKKVVTKKEVTEQTIEEQRLKELFTEPVSYGPPTDKMVSMQKTPGQGYFESDYGGSDPL